MVLESIYGTHKPYLSYSAIQLWLSNKDKYREQYYQGKKWEGNRYTVYGSHIHKEIEEGRILVQNMPTDVYQHEVDIRTTIQGVDILARIDIIGEKHLYDVKTGLKKWSTTQVQKLDQLPFYSACVQAHTKKKINKVGVIWVETEEREDIDTRYGVLLSRGKQVLRTEREPLLIPRTIEQWERDRQVDIIVRTAEEIRNDYIAWSRANCG